MLAIAGVGALATLEACHKDGEGGEDTSATEDMMREHGVFRHILVAYRETAAMIRAGTNFDVRALADAAELFRTFGEDYHEHKLEEEHVFPAVRKAGGPAAGLIDTLLQQHQRGREINSFLVATCEGSTIPDARRQDLASALENYARMYEAHAAQEDTIIFQAWRNGPSKHVLKEAGEQFENIEKAQFHGDGFDQASIASPASSKGWGLRIWRDLPQTRVMGNAWRPQPSVLPARARIHRTPTSAL